MPYRLNSQPSEVRWIPSDITDEMASTSVFKYSNKMGRWTVEEIELEMPTNLSIRLGAIVLMNKQATGETFYSLSMTDILKLQR